MRSYLILSAIVAAGFGWGATGKTGYGPKPFEFYQSIIDRAPFGVIAAGDAAGPGGVAAPDDQVKIEQEQLAKQISMSGITIMPDGTLAVGFADMSVNPAASYFLAVGKNAASGWSVIAANYKQEWATLEKDGVQVTIQLGKGVIAAPPAAEVDTKPQPAVQAEVGHVTAPVGTGFGRLNRPSRAGLPPMPNLKANLEKVKQRQAELAKIRAEGGDVKSYMERLRERNKAEAEAKQAVEETARQQLTQVAETERAKKERELNLELIRQGARPLSDITLTPEEEKDLVDKGILAP